MEVIIIFVLWAIAVYRQASKKYDASLKLRAIEEKEAAREAEAFIHQVDGLILEAMDECR